MRARLFGVLRASNVTVNTSVAVPQAPEAVIVIRGETKEDYIRGLRMARGELEPPPMTEFPPNGNGSSPNGHH